MTRTAAQRARDETLIHRLRLIRFENSLSGRLQRSFAGVRRGVLDALVAAAGGNTVSVESLVARVDDDVRLFVDAQMPTLTRELDELYRVESDKTHAIITSGLGAAALRMTRVNKAPRDTDVQQSMKLELDAVRAGLLISLAAPVTSKIRDVRREALRRSIAVGPGDSSPKGLGIGAAVASGLAGLSVGAILRDRLPLVRNGFARSEAVLDSKVRTITQSVANQAQSRTFQANKHLIYGQTYTAVLDNRICPVCARWQGTTFWDERPPGGFDFRNRPISEVGQATPPLHARCRCMFLPVYREARAIFNDPPRTLQDHLDGKAPEIKSFEQWFRGISVSDQREILGPARLKLWEAGKIDVEDLVNDNRVLTLEELGKSIGATL